MTFGRALGVKGASVTIPLQGGAVRARGRGRRRSRAASAPSTRFASIGRPVGRRQHRRRRDSWRRCSERVPLAGPARVGPRRRRRGAGGGRGARVERLPRPRARAQPRAGRGGGDWSRRPRSARGRRSRAAGTCWSTARRSGCIRDVDDTPVAAGAADGPLRLRPGLQPARRRGCCARRRRRAARRSAASRCSSPRRTSSSSGGPDVRPPAGVMREAALKRLAEFTRDENYVV